MQANLGGLIESRIMRFFGHSHEKGLHETGEGESRKFKKIWSHAFAGVTTTGT
jgi:hypothetical protein